MLTRLSSVHPTIEEQANRDECAQYRLAARLSLKTLTFEPKTLSTIILASFEAK